MSRTSLDYPKLYSVELQHRYPRAWRQDELERLYRSAEITAPPLPLGHGATVYEGIGQFQKVFNEKGELALLFAELSENICFAPLPEETQGLWRERFKLESDKRFPGLYLEDHKDGNLGNVRVPKVISSPEDEYKLDEYMKSFAERVLSFRRDHCRLKRKGPNHWGTKSISYRLTPSRKSTDEKELWDLRITIAPNVHTGLPDDDKCFKGLRGIFMNVGSILVPDLARKEAEAKIPRDFAKRARLLEANFDLYRPRPRRTAKALTSAPAPRLQLLKGSLEKVKSRLDKKSRDRFFINANQTLGRMGWKDIREAFAMVGGVNIGLGVFLAMTGDVAISLVVLLAKIAAQGMGRLVSEIVKKAGQNEVNLQEDAINHKITLKLDPNNPLGSRFDPVQRPYWAALTNEQGFLHATYTGKEISNEQRAMMRIVNALRRRAGTNMTAFMAGHHPGIRFKEPGGLDIESIPDRGIHFARINNKRSLKARVDHLVLQLLSKNPDDKPFLMVEYKPNTGEILATPLSEAQYRSEFKKIEMLPPEQGYKFPHEMPPLPDPPAEIMPQTAGVMREFARRVGRWRDGAVRACSQSPGNYPAGPCF